MKAAERAATVLVLFALGALTLRSQGSQQTGDASPSNTRQMRCVVKVTTNADIIPLSVGLVDSLLRSDGVAGEAARGVWPRGTVPRHSSTLYRCWTFRKGVRDTLTENLRTELQETFVSHRIAEIQQLLAGSTTFDTAFDRVQWAARRCRQADARVHETRTRIANLRPCIVTIIGGIE